MSRYTFTLKLSAFLLLSTLAFAKDWQWERYEGDYRNPTGFPQHVLAVGDFDGDGADELLSDYGGNSYFYRMTGNADTLRWTASEPFTGLSYYGWSHFFPINLDDIPGEELIIDQNTCWSLVSSDPITWQEQPTQLAPLLLPDSTIALLYGDYTGNELLNAVSLSEFGRVHLYERDPDDVWTAINEWTVDWLGGGYDGDFDHDGDLDFALYAPLYCDPCDVGTALFENRGELGIEFHEPSFAGFIMPFVHPMGGDLDGDGEWEGIHNTFARYGNYLLEVNAMEPHFLTSASSWALSSFYLSGTGSSILGNIRRDGISYIAGVRGLHYDTFPGGNTFWTEVWTPRGRVEVNVGFEDFGSYRCNRTNMGGDVNGDGKLDLLAEIISGNSNRVWWLKLNSGDETRDIFSSSNVSFSCFTQNADTSFHSPCLGDINGDGRAELIVLANWEEQARQVLVFEFVGEGAATEFQLNESLSLGLPVGFTKIRTTDLDGDGLAELFCTSDNSWSVFFFRNSRWLDYSDILPDFESTELGFADFDNDGDMDIFTDNDVWISLSPSPSSEDFVLHPSSFSLSAYPNPFNPTTTIRFNLPDAGKVSLDVFNIQGRQVESLLNQPMTAGEYSVTFDGSALPSGVYFANLTTTGQTAAHKLLLLK
ncbi:T9SS type A sorting domain-containing protein [bacterium]|nr:T9SS type A sorting domain-containing protein [bacterium]